MIDIILILFWLSGIFCFVISFYLFLSIFVASTKKEDNMTAQSYLKKFAIVIPAHNESTLIEKTLRSVLDVDYPKNLFDIYVIADNCSDNTADIARKMRTHCLERNDELRLGKGYALQWFFEYSVDNNFPHDVFLVVDADSIVSKNILRSMNRKFCNGIHALTSRYEVLKPEKSVTSSISFFSFLLRNLRCNGLDFLGGSAQLLGNGMGFTMELIRKYGWRATSITEDREQWAILHLKDISVGFINDAAVYAAMPDTFENYRVPRARWDIGTFEVSKKYFIPFLKVFLKKKNLASFAMLIELLTPPFTYFLFINIIFFLITIFASIQLESKGMYLNVIWTVNISLVLLSVFMALIKSNATYILYRNITFYLPFFVIWRIWNLVTEYLKNHGKKWIRSRRG